MAAQVVGQGVSSLMLAHVVLGDLAGVGEGLGHGVVAGKLLEVAAAEEIGAGVADVDQEEVNADAVREGHGGAHAEEPAIRLALAGDPAIDLAEVGAQPRRAGRGPPSR